MTEKLYEENPYLKDFTARVMSVREIGGKYHVELDRTCFYPEGGGQPCDLGNIGPGAVEYVYEEAGNIFHVTGQTFACNDTVCCSIDWDRRFDHMQQHLGQHMLSAVLFESFKAATVSFHLGSEVSTIDLDMLPEAAQIAEAEDKVNRVVYENRPVRAFYPSDDELARMTLRKAPQVNENIRIVQIKELDNSACCGTHPSFTGEVGVIKITNTEKYKGGARLEFLCGRRALKDYSRKSAAVSEIASALSIRGTDVKERFDRLCEENRELRKEKKLLEDRLLDYRAGEMLLAAEDIRGVRLVVKCFEGADPGEFRLLSQKLASRPGTVCLFGLISPGTAEFIFSRSRELGALNLRLPCKEALELLEGRGGGNENAVQGRGSRAENLETVLRSAAEWVKNVLNGG